ncbi:YdjN3 [Bacillus atrophaeus UCMB-5137]|nr:YdjN3 [Bacillus atrophaeus UCMB-5137]
MKNVEKANVTGNPLKPPKTIFSIIDSKQTKQIGSLTKPIQDVAIAPKGDKVLFTSDSESDDEARTVFELDLESNKYKPLFKEDGKFKLLSQSFPQYSPDGKEVYFLGIDSKAKSYTDESTGREIKERTIYSYTRQSKEFAKRWEKSNGVINNFSVLN